MVKLFEKEHLNSDKEVEELPNQINDRYMPGIISSTRNKKNMPKPKHNIDEN